DHRVVLQPQVQWQRAGEIEPEGAQRVDGAVVDVVGAAGGVEELEVRVLVHSSGIDQVVRQIVVDVAVAGIDRAEDIRGGVAAAAASEVLLQQIRVGERDLDEGAVRQLAAPVVERLDVVDGEVGLDVV